MSPSSLKKYNIVRNVPPSIFRAYDVRGIVDETLTPDIIFTLGLAIGSEAQHRGIRHLTIARDVRLSGRLFIKALCAGLIDSGCDVTYIGIVPTPLLYFSLHFLNIHSGVMLTGSHNPPDYNGLKIVLAGKSLTEHEVLSLLDRIVANDLQRRIRKGQLTHRRIVPSYLDYITHDISLQKPLRIVIDCGNSVGGKIAPQLFKRLGCDVIPLFCEMDGTFPNHHPDPSVAENLHTLIDTVKKEQADIGFAFDGDADRLGVVTNDGDIIWPDRQLMLFAKDVLARHPGASIVFDVKCSRHLANFIRSHGGKPQMWKTGHSLIKNRMLELDAILAGEMSGHLFFRERWFGFDDGIYAAARLLEIISQESDDVSTLFHQFPNSINTPEIKVPVNEKDKFSLVQKIIKIAQLPDTVSDALTMNTLDGLRIEFSYGWGLVRASNTTACLTLRFEADTKDNLQHIQLQFKQLLVAADSTIDIPVSFC